jgi:hypothetical protein
VAVVVGRWGSEGQQTYSRPRNFKDNWPSPDLHFGRAGHSLIFSRFAIRSPLNFFPWIADAHAFIFLISLFARRSNTLRSSSGSLSEKGLNHSSLSINIWAVET